MRHSLNELAMPLDDQGSLPGRGGNFFLFHRIHTDLEVHSILLFNG